MNDRYLFRGKRLDNGAWMQSSLAQFHDFNGNYTVAISERCRDLPSTKQVELIWACVDPATIIGNVHDTEISKTVSDAVEGGNERE